MPGASDSALPTAGRAESALCTARRLTLFAALHYAAYLFMQTLALLAETRRGPTLPDLVLDAFPAHREFDWINSSFWLPGLLLALVLLAWKRPCVCIDYLKVGAAVSIARGLFIVATGLGPPPGTIGEAPQGFLHLQMADITPGLLLRQWIPIDAFWGGSGLSAVYLTQDLFFSGHTATTFLLVLLTWRRDLLAVPFLAFHLVTVTFLFVTHEHYTIDILGAYFIVYALFHWFRGRRWIVTTEAG